MSGKQVASRSRYKSCSHTVIHTSLVTTFDCIILERAGWTVMKLVKVQAVFTFHTCCDVYIFIAELGLREE